MRAISGSRNTKRPVVRRLAMLSLASGLIATTLGIAAFADSQTLNASDVSVGSSAAAMASQVSTEPLTFDQSVQTSIVQFNDSDASSTGVTATFYQSYMTATEEYNIALQSASQIYADTVTTDPVAARDAYIASFTQARTEFLAKIEAARNTLLSELWGEDTAGAKDAFVNEYNAARDRFTQQLDALKSQIAALPN